jgi:hypothetical protein
MTVTERQEVKHFATKAVVFVIIFLLSDFILGKTFRAVFLSQKVKTTYGIFKATEDLIVIGSSRATHHYIPSILSDSLKISCFNLGSDGQNIYYDYGMIGSILNRYNPKIIILDVTPSDYTLTDATHNTDNLSIFLPYVKSNQYIKEVVNLRGPVEQIKLLSCLYPFNSQLTNVLFAIIKKRNNPYFTMNGYIPIFSETMQNLQVQEGKEINVDLRKISFVKKLITLCRINNIRLIVIVSPSYFKIINKSNSEFDIKSLFVNKGVEFWDFQQDSIFLSKRYYFADINHLNNLGATEYSKRIAHKIKTPLK